MNKMTTKRVIGFVIGVVILITSILIGETEALSREATISIGLLLMGVAMWVCETFPVSVTGFVIIALGFFLGVMAPDQLFTGFATGVIWYVVAVCALAGVFLNTNYGVKLLNWLLKKFGKKPSGIVLVFMIAPAILSTVMSNITALIIFLPVAFMLFKAAGISKETKGGSNLAKAIVIAMVFGCTCGGMATPAGGTFNIMAWSYAPTIGFVQWMVAGIPCAIVVLFLCWLWLTRVFKLEDIDEVRNVVQQKVDEAGPATAQEKKAMFVFILLPVLWILGNWIPFLNVTAVALLGVGLMFLPKMDLLTWKEYNAQIPWNAIIMVGCIMSLGAVMTANGAMAWLVSLITSTGIGAMPFMVALFVVLVFVYVIHAAAPVTAAFIILFVPLIMGLCEAAGVPTEIACLAMAFLMGGSFLLPLNPLNVIAYDTGYFTFGDFIKAGIVPSIIILVVVTLWVPFISGILW